ncbi:MAG: bifunctional 4-hydroxy-3-methylbut-2-enyl diphosphate reductase/30S ribosomal protein S1 [Oscillospiraceae bacterium]|nr:bifunctional 4-hydroxy-3-methylbut-2-enyl diphosphate reductase/30S ribosomal protein S1 [Oscillospiraceae bacterium]
MKIVKANYCGFCFGVRRAVETVCNLTTDEPIYTIGKLIHNHTILNDLELRGIKCIDDIDGIIGTVVIRAHGIPKHLNDKLNSNPNIKVIDCTCPDVKKIHRIVENNPAELTVISGDESHPEVEGIKSYAKGKTLVCSSYDELTANRQLLENISVVAVAQTTQNQKEWIICQEFIKKVCTNPLIFDTICNVTEKRQAEVYNLSKNVDIMLIIGDKESSNTNKLYNIAKENLAATFFIESISDLPLEYVSPHMTVGIAAGASTPDSIIKEVIKTMQEQENMEADIEVSTQNQGGSEANFAEPAFADMIENSLKTLNTGETVKGIITSISPNEIHVDLGAKVTGIISTDEMPEHMVENIGEFYKVGDEIEAFIILVSDRDGVATLSRKKIESILMWRKIVGAVDTHEILEGKVTEVVRNGIIITINSYKLFIPASQTGLPINGDLNQLVGTTQRIKIIEVNEQRKRAVGSIRAVIREERKQREDDFWNNIEVGKKFEGTVKSFTSYGTFVDIGGVDGMIHTSELSWQRIKHPSEILNIGDEIVVYIINFNRETKKIALGYKTEDTNPWAIFTGKYNVDDVVTVKIVSMMPFGAFAEIIPNIDGLIHISQISDHKINQPADVLKIGQIVDTKITAIDNEKHKVNLSIRALVEEAKVIAEISENIDAIASGILIEEDNQ